MTLVPEGLLRFSNAAEVLDYRATDFFDEKEAGFLDRFAQFAVVAAREAVADAGLDFSSGIGESTAIITGSCVGGQTTEDEGFRDLYERKSTRFHPLTIPRVMANAGASRISLEYGITGPVYTISTACSSANHAIGQAFWMVRSGVVDLAIAGGSEAPFSLGLLKSWEAMRVVSPDTCRPFSRDRRGLILGEGAAMLVLEPLERAQARGAKIWGEIAGFGMSSDAYHITQPSALGAARAMRAALLDSGAVPKTSDTSTRTVPEHPRTIPRKSRPSVPCSARTPRSCRSAPPNRCMAMRSERPERWRLWPRCWRFMRVSFRRPRILPGPIPPAIWMWCPIPRGALRSSGRSRTHSHLAGLNAVLAFRR